MFKHPKILLNYREDIFIHNNVKRYNSKLLKTKLSDLK